MDEVDTTITSLVGQSLTDTEGIGTSPIGKSFIHNLQILPICEQRVTCVRRSCLYLVRLESLRMDPGSVLFDRVHSTVIPGRLRSGGAGQERR